MKTRPSFILDPFGRMVRDRTVLERWRRVVRPWRTPEQAFSRGNLEAPRGRLNYRKEPALGLGFAKMTAVKTCERPVPHLVHVPKAIT